MAQFLSLITGTPGDCVIRIDAPDDDIEAAIAEAFDDGLYPNQLRDRLAEYVDVTTVWESGEPWPNGEPPNGSLAYQGE